jgi:hypothetical protein
MQLGEVPTYPELAAWALIFVENRVAFAEHDGEEAHLGRMLRGVGRPRTSIFCDDDALAAGVGKLRGFALPKARSRYDGRGACSQAPVRSRRCCSRSSVRSTSLAGWTIANICAAT